MDQVTNYVTIPSFQEINNQRLTISQYAIANGGHANLITIRPNEDICRYGYGWLRDGTSYFWTGTAGSRYQPQLNVTDIAAAPRFINPNALGLGIKHASQGTYLTYQKHKVLYPQQKVDNQTAQILTAAYYSQAPALTPVGTFTGTQPSQIHQCYRWHNHIYLRMPHHGKFDKWFLCEPVTVTATPDGSLQCTQMLVTLPFHHPTRGDLHDFLNTCFLDDLRQSIKLNQHKKLTTCALQSQRNDLQFDNLPHRS